MSSDNSSSQTEPDIDLPETEAEASYPHNIHPGLVPGIAVEDQRNKFGIDWTIFSVVAVLIIAFVSWGLISPESVSETATTMFAWGMENMGWLLNITMTLGVFLMVYVAFSRFGKIRLGKDDEARYLFEEPGFLG